MPNIERNLAVLEALSEGTDPLTGELLPPDSVFNQGDVVRALMYAVQQLKGTVDKGNKGKPWTEQEEGLLRERFKQSSKVSELAKLHGRTYGAIRSRLVKIGLLESEENSDE